MNEDNPLSNEMNNMINEKLDKNDRITKLKQDYLEVKSFMENLNSNLRVEVLIPVSENLAYFKGIIKHTNECTIFLGDEYFAKTVNKKAIDIIDNRIKNLEKISIIKDDKEINMDNLYKVEKGNQAIEENENVRKIVDGSFEIIENYSESENISPEIKVEEKIVSKKNSGLSELERERLWQEKIKRLKVLEAQEDGEISIEQGENRNYTESVIKSPKDIFKLMTNVKKLNEEINEVIITSPSPKSITKDQKMETIPIPIEVKNEKEEGSIVKNLGKKKDVINLVPNFNSKKNDDEIKEKRSLFFDDNDN